MKKVNLQRVKSLIASVLLASTLIGCAGAKSHDQLVDDSNDRWRALRGAMILPMAQRYFETGDLDEAERAINEALSVDPNNHQMFLLAGRIALERGLLERSFLQLQQAIDLDTNKRNVEAHYYQGVVLQRWRKYDQALECYNEAYRRKPDNPGYLLARCEMLVALDRQDEAIGDLKAKVDYFDQSVGVRAALAHLHKMNGQYKMAAHYFHEATLLDPDSSALREELGRAQLAAAEYESAVRTLKVLLSDPSVQGRPSLRRLLAEAYFGAGQLTQARQIYIDLTRGRNSDAADWIRLGEMAWQEGDGPAALTAANRAIRLAPQNAKGYLLAGMVWQKRSRLENALRNFDRAGELAPSDPVPHLLRGVSLQQAGRFSGARDAYEQALRRDPDDSRARKLLQSLASGS